MVRDLVVIGAGPAGLMAAALAAEHSADVLLLDDQAGPGGQIYRAIEQANERQKSILGKDYAKGLEIARRFRESEAQYRPDSTVWQVTDDLEIACSSPDGSRLIKAHNIILATGATERPFPVPGWTLPGVMTAGAAQTLLKSSSLACRRRRICRHRTASLSGRGSVFASWIERCSRTRHDGGQALGARPPPACPQPSCDQSFC